MKQTYMLMLLTFVAVFGLIGMFSQVPLTGSVVQEDLTLLIKIKQPCFCIEAGNISQQQIAFYTLVESAESGVARKQISETFAISLLNKTAEDKCAKCIQLQIIQQNT